MIRTVKELKQRAAAAKELFDAKFNGGDGKIYLMICGGGGCTASGAMNVKAECEKLIEEKGLQDKVKVLVGGAPVTQDFCNKIQADGYTADAASAAERAVEFCK